MREGLEKIRRLVAKSKESGSLTRIYVRGLSSALNAVDEGFVYEMKKGETHSFVTGNSGVSISNNGEELTYSPILNLERWRNVALYHRTTSGIHRDEGIHVFLRGERGDVGYVAIDNQGRVGRFVPLHNVPLVSMSTRYKPVVLVVNYRGKIYVVKLSRNVLHFKR